MESRIANKAVYLKCCRSSVVRVSVAQLRGGEGGEVQDAPSLNLIPKRQLKGRRLK